MSILVSTETKTFISNKIGELLNKDLYNINLEVLGKRQIEGDLVSDYRLTLSEILSSATPLINFYTFNTTGTFNIPDNQQAFVIVDDLVNSFTLEFNGVNGSLFVNNFDVNDFSNCYLDITNTSLVSSNKDRVYVTENVSFSTVNNEFFTFYYFNTGSLILGFSPTDKTLEEPLNVPDIETLPEPEGFESSLGFNLELTSEVFLGNIDGPPSENSESMRMGMDVAIIYLGISESDFYNTWGKIPVPNGTLIPYTITGVETSSVNIPLNGNFEIQDGWITENLTFSAHPIFNKGNQTLKISLNETPEVSATIVIQDTSPSLDLWFSAHTHNDLILESFDEGDQFDLNMLAGEGYLTPLWYNVLKDISFPFTVTGTSENDISPLQGTFNLISDQGDFNVVTLSALEDIVQDGQKTLIATLDNVTPVVSASIIINDTSFPEYTLNIFPPSVDTDEGINGRFFELQSNVPDNTEVPFTITGISPEDIDIPLTGVFNVQGGVSQIPFNIIEDNTEEGPETLLITLDNVTPTVSASIIINDTSYPE